MRVKILVIDDEESICEILRYNLEKDGYEVDTANSAEEALGYDLPSYSLFIVDIMMGRLSGFDFVKRIKNDTATENIPIIFCSALDGEDDTVMGLNIGSDDYITKPFKIGVVLARVRSVLRRSKIVDTIRGEITRGAYEPDIVFKTLRIDRNAKTCYLDGKMIDLSRREFDILLFLLTHRGRIYSRDDILRLVWPDDVVVTKRTVDTNIARLRKKLDAYAPHIVTRLGFGYGFEETP